MIDEVPGLLVCDLATAVRDHSALVTAPLDRVVVPDPSSATLVHVSAGVQLSTPVAHYVGHNALAMPPAATTLVIAEAGSSVTIIEGCAAPMYTSHATRSSTVRAVVGAEAEVRHLTMQNWATNVDNSITKDAEVAAGGRIEWVDAVVGSRSTTLRHRSRLQGAGSAASSRVMLSAVSGQHHLADIGVLHAGGETEASSVIKMLGAGDGVVEARTSDETGGTGTRVHALHVDGEPSLHWSGPASEADVERSAVDEAHVAYLRARGLSRRDAVALIVSRFVDEVTSSLPMEFAVEWEQLVERLLDASRH